MRRALAGRVASDYIVSKRLVSFGKTNLCEVPQPILNCMKTAFICCARLTTSATSVQVNIVDQTTFVPPPRPKMLTSESGKDKLLAKVWK
jgi:hypothetical protein